jgi:uncharacterized iron-regulated membrane protein
MKKLIVFWYVVFAAGAALVTINLLFGCSGLSNTTFHLEATAVDLATGARAGFSNYYCFATNGADAATLAKLNAEAASFRDARLRFAATVGTLESLRSAYSTNSTLRPQVEAGLQAVNVEASNLVFLVNYFRGGTNL